MNKMGSRLIGMIMVTIILSAMSYRAIAQSVGINETGTSPNTSAGLDVDFTDRGILIPRMATIERNAIVSSENSLLIYNTTTECFEAYHSASSSWVSISCLGCQLPGSFSASTATNITGTGFDASWTASSGATTYYLDVDDNADFSSPVSGYDNKNVGNVITSTVSGLACGTYYYRLRAENSCGTTSNSNTTTAVVSCFTGCIATANTVVQDVTNPSTGKTWMDRNLGASQVATSTTDASAYGCLYQWGRLDDGHEDRASSTTATLSTSDTPGHSDFITAAAPNDWRNPQNDNLWQGVSGTNNPCPTGYRVATDTELDAERVSWPTNNSAGAYASPLKFSNTGYRMETGALDNVDVAGYSWSSTVTGTSVNRLGFGSSSAGIANNGRVRGFPVRCIKD